MKRTTPPARRRHSPEARTRLILEAADRLFGEKGYLNTSINDLIAACGGSKATIAQRFGNKAGLFGAVLSNYAAQVSARISTRGASGDVPQTLQAIGELILGFYLERRSLEAYRGVIAAGPTEHDVAKRVYRDGHLRITHALADVLRRWQREGRIRCTAPEQAADRFTHMLRHGIYEQALIGLRRRVSERECRRHVQATVEAFLNGTALLLLTPG